MNPAAAIMVLSCSLGACAAISGLACGAESATPDARDTAQEWIDARNSAEFRRVCELTAPETRAQLAEGFGSCVSYYRDAAPLVTRMGFSLADMQQDGSMATATLRTSTAGLDAVLRLRLEEGEWRVSGVGP